MLRNVLSVGLVLSCLHKLMLPILLLLTILLLTILPLTILLLLPILLRRWLLLVLLRWLLILGLLKASGGQPLEEHEQLGLGDDAIFLEVEGLHILPHFWGSEPSGLIELNVELVEEGVEFVDIERAVAIAIVHIEHFIDEHSEHSVI